MTETEIKARERAVEIVNSYHNILAKRIPDMLIVKYEAKQCALIACDLLLNNLPHTDLNFRKWQSVRAEIEKL